MRCTARGAASGTACVNSRLEGDHESKCVSGAGRVLRLILNGINGRYLREITDNAAKTTDYVEAAVAYATDETLLFDWCWNNNIPLRFWGRFDDSVPVAVRILRSFLTRKSPNFACKLLTHFHAKVIWWHGVGAYVGSANLSDPAWYGNIEAGCFFDETEMEASAIDIQLRAFFRRIDENASPLTEELFKVIEDRAKELERLAEQDRNQRERFRRTTVIKQWKGLLREGANTAAERQKNAFLNEWYSTLQTLRDIGSRISEDKNRPAWLPKDIPAGAQADQFLHAHYYNNVIDVERRSRFAEHYEMNKGNPERALRRAIDWWRSQPAPPSNEDRMLLEWAPFLRESLSSERVLQLSEGEFEEVCQRVWSIQDHGRRVSNVTLNLPGDRRHDMATKTEALAKFLFSRRSKNGSNVLEVINYLLYGGSDEALPTRLWECTTDGPWRIEHLGISALGELIGWALPNRFPPRNNRTSKSLRSLGFPVDVHG